MVKPRDGSNTAERILDVAEELVQTRGFNAFSYADVAEVMNVTKASLHYHFSTKAVLGAELISRYSTRFMAALALLESRHTSALTRLEAYTELYATVLDTGRMCMCGMLAADILTLPGPMAAGVRAFFAANEAWLAHQLEAGAAQNDLRLTAPARELAQALIAGLEGAMLLSRMSQDAAQFRRIARQLVTRFVVDPIDA